MSFERIKSTDSDVPSGTPHPPRHSGRLLKPGRRYISGSNDDNPDEQLLQPTQPRRLRQPRRPRRKSPDQRRIRAQQSREMRRTLRKQLDRIASMLGLSHDFTRFEIQLAVIERLRRNDDDVADTGNAATPAPATPVMVDAADAAANTAAANTAAANTADIADTADGVDLSDVGYIFDGPLKLLEYITPTAPTALNTPVDLSVLDDAPDLLGNSI